MGAGRGCGQSAMKKTDAADSNPPAPSGQAAPPVPKPASVPVQPTPAPPASATAATPAASVEPLKPQPAEVPATSDKMQQEAVATPTVGLNVEQPVGTIQNAPPETGTAQVAGPDAPAAQAVTDAPVPAVGNAKIFIVYYSMYGHVAKLAAKIKEGVDSVEGAEGIIYQVPETLPEQVLAKMGAPPKPADIPVINAHSLVEADAIIFGFPTRFGMMCGQMKAFLDATGSLWKSQALAGKAGGIFFSTGTQGGGQETTALTAISQLAHHGMLFVPIGFTFPGMYNPEVHGGSAYGAGTYAGDGTRVPLDVELEMAAHQGKMIASFAAKYKKGPAF